MRAVVGTCMQSSSQIEISLCTSRAITRAINGNHEGNQGQSQGQSMAITRAIKGNQEGNQGSVVERITGDQEQ